MGEEERANECDGEVDEARRDRVDQVAANKSAHADASVHGHRGNHNRVGAVGSERGRLVGHDDAAREPRAIADTERANTPERQTDDLCGKRAGGEAGEEEDHHRGDALVFGGQAKGRGRRVKKGCKGATQELVGGRGASEASDERDHRKDPALATDEARK